MRPDRGPAQDHPTGERAALSRAAGDDQRAAVHAARRVGAIQRPDDRCAAGAGHATMSKDPPGLLAPRFHSDKFNPSKQAPIHRNRAVQQRVARDRARAKEIARAHGHKDVEEIIVCRDLERSGIRVPVWQFYIAEAELDLSLTRCRPLHHCGPGGPPGPGGGTGTGK